MLALVGRAPFASLLLASAAWCVAAPAKIPLLERNNVPYLRCVFDDLTADGCYWDSGSVVSNVPNAPPLSSYPVVGKKDGRSLIRVRSIIFGESEFGPAEVWRGEGGGPVLGMNILSGRRLEAKASPQSQLVVDSDANLGGLALPLIDDGHGRYVIEISLGARRVKALWDTGAADTRISRSLIRRAVPGEFEKIGEYASRQEVLGRYRINAFGIGGVVFSDIQVFEMDFGSDIEMILGWDMIRRLDWRLDPKRGLWSVSNPQTH